MHTEELYTVAVHYHFTSCSSEENNKMNQQDTVGQHFDEDQQSMISLKV